MSRVYQVEYNSRYSPHKKKGWVFGERSYKIAKRTCTIGTNGEIPPKQWLTCHFFLIYNPTENRAFHQNIRRQAQDIKRTGLSMPRDMFEYRFKKIDELMLEHGGECE